VVDATDPVTQPTRKYSLFSQVHKVSEQAPPLKWGRQSNTLIINEKTPTPFMKKYKQSINQALDAISARFEEHFNN